MVGEVPRFPEFCDLDLELGGEVGDALRRLDPEVAEFTFANLYLFRRAHRYRLSRLDGLLLVLGEGYDGVPYAFPPLGPGDPGRAVALLADRLRAEGGEPVFFPVPGPLAAGRFSAPGWQAAPDRDQADYLYLRSDLAELPGPRFHKRKNRLLKFLREVGDGYVYAELADEHVPQSAELADGWCELRCAPERPSTYQETEAAREALVHRRVLGLRGGVILLGGRVRAFCLGEELNPETFVVHFEKAEPGLEGLAQVINRDFCRHSLGRYRYVNREQDLGDPGLRRAKEAYHPVRLVEKFRVRPAVRP